MSERILPSRKRKRASPGKRIAISDTVYDMLQKKRQAKMSWDCLFRRMLGLPTRQGASQPLIEGFVEITTGRFFVEERDAYEVAILEAAKAKTKKVNKPLRVREVV